MADQRLTQLSTATTLANSDLFYVVQNVTGTDGSSAKITFQDLNSQITPGGGSAWVLADSNTSISGVNHVDFINLSAYSEIMVFYRQVTFGSADQCSVRVSSDNGSTFYSTSGDYVLLPATGAESNNTGIFPQSAAATAARSGVVGIEQFNIATYHIARTPLRNDASSSAVTYISQIVALNAVRVYSFSANNFTGGAIYVFGR